MYRKKKNKIIMNYINEEDTYCMDELGLSLSLTSALKLCGVKKIDKETMDLFLRDEASGKSFQKKTGLSYEEINVEELFCILNNLNLIEPMRFSKSYKIELDEESANGFLDIDKNKLYFLLLGLKYNQLLSRMGNHKISYDLKYSVLSSEKTDEETINKLVLASKKKK
jgi:hypothetical protein